MPKKNTPANSRTRSGRTQGKDAPSQKGIRLPDTPRPPPQNARPSSSAELNDSSSPPLRSTRARGATRKANTAISPGKSVGSEARSAADKKPLTKPSSANVESTPLAREGRLSRKRPQSMLGIGDSVPKENAKKIKALSSEGNHSSESGATDTRASRSRSKGGNVEKSIDQSPSDRVESSNRSRSTRSHNSSVTNSSPHISDTDNKMKKGSTNSMGPPTSADIPSRRRTRTAESSDSSKSEGPSTRIRPQGSDESMESTGSSKDESRSSGSLNMSGISPAAGRTSRAKKRQLTNTDTDAGSAEETATTPPPTKARRTTSAINTSSHGDSAVAMEKQGQKSTASKVAAEKKVANKKVAQPKTACGSPKAKTPTKPAVSSPSKSPGSAKASALTKPGVSPKAISPSHPTGSPKAASPVSSRSPKNIRATSPSKPQPKPTADKLVSNAGKPTSPQVSPGTNSKKAPAKTTFAPTPRAVPRRAEDPLFNRNFIPYSDSLNESASDSSSKTSAKQSSTGSFTVITYNILAEFHRRKYDYSYSSENVLSHPYRSKRFLEELMYLDGDVVCLQEVEPTYYKEKLQPAMNKAGYDGLYKKRCQNVMEGEATFWKKKAFTLVDSESISTKDLIDKHISVTEQSDDVKEALRGYVDRDAVMIIARLRSEKTQQTVAIGNIHVTFVGFEATDVQCIQTSCAVKAMVDSTKSASLPFILCGDFNSKVTDPAYQIARDGYLSNESLNRLQSYRTVCLPGGKKDAVVNLIWTAFQHAAASIRSTYATVQDGKEPEVTSRNKLMDECVDYMWVSRLKIDGVWEVAPLNHPIPSAIFPSDHLSLKAQYSFVEKKD